MQFDRISPYFITDAFQDVSVSSGRLRYSVSREKADVIAGADGSIVCRHSGQRKQLWS
jgi:hypothetical protein